MFGSTTIPGCRAIGNTFFPPHSLSAWDNDAEYSVALKDDVGAAALVVQGGQPKLAELFTRRRDALKAKADRAIGGAPFKTLEAASLIQAGLGAIGSGIKAESKRYSVQENSVGSIQMSNRRNCASLLSMAGDGPPCPCDVASDPNINIPITPQAIEGALLECSKTSPLFLAIKREAPNDFYWWDRKNEKSVDFVYILQVIPDTDIGAARFVPVLLIVNRTEVKVAAIDISRPWGLLWPWMWLYEGIDLLPFLDWHAVNGSMALKMQAADPVSQPQLRDLGSVTLKLKEWNVRSLPYVWVNKKTGIPSEMPYFGMTSTEKLAVNVYTEAAENNDFGKALNFLGELLSSKADKIADKATSVFGLDKDATGSDSATNSSSAN